MIKMKSLIATSIILALTACDGGDEEVGSSAQSVGTLEIVGSDLFAGAPLSVSLTDTDGVVDGSVTYSWVRNPDGTTVDLSTASSYTLTEEDEGSIIQVTALYSTNSGLFKSKNVLTTEIRPTLDVSAFAIKGPIDNATCSISEVDENGVASTVTQASSPSDATGAVTFTGVHFTGNGLISCTGGTYTDESTGNTLTAPTLRAVVDVVEDGTTQDEDGNDVPVIVPDYIVSPLTELAVETSASDLNTTLEQAELINGRFGLRFDTTETFPTIIGEDTLGVNGAEDADQYGAVLALISQYDADSESDIGTILAGLSSDLADGSFSEETQSIFETAQTNLETTSVVANLIDAGLFDTISAAISNDPIPATFEGELSGTINSSSTIALTGKVTVNDINLEEDSIIVQTDVTTTYGTFSIDTDGNWSYFVNTTNTTVAALQLGNSVNELVTITSIDGTTTTIDIKVAALTKLVEITNTAGDTGEVKFKVNNLRQGKLSVSFLKEVAIGSDIKSKDAYITLYGSSGSSSESLIDLRIQGDQIDNTTLESIAPRFLVRNTDNAAYSGDVVTAPFVENQFYEVDIAWDLDAAEQITLTIDGDVIGGGAFSTAAPVDSDFTDLNQWFADGIQSIQFRFGDNGTTIPRGSYFVDNIEVYSDAAGTVSVFEDDFESYIEGETLDGVDTLYDTSIYSEVIAFEAADPNAPTPADFTELTGAINSDTTTATGQVKVFDDAGEDSITASTSTGTYGTLVITEDGSWTYTLDITNPEIAPLEVGERKTETFTISSVDGTEADLVITISGTIAGINGGPGTAGNQFATIADTLTDDVGELRYRLGTEQTSGSVSFSFKKDNTPKTTLPDSTGTKNASVILFGDSTSSSDEVVQLEIKSSTIVIDDIETTFATTFTASTEWVDVLMEWDATDAVTDGGVSVTITINGTEVESVISPKNKEFNIRNIQFALGTKSDTNSGNFSIDDLIIIGADGSEILNDNFEAFVVGDVLDGTDDVYHANSSEATVAEE